MTREEKIELLEFVRQGLLINARVKSDYDIAEALGTAISALKGPTREQVEKVWRGEWVLHKSDDVFSSYHTCSNCGCKYGESSGVYIFDLKFCPHCGVIMKAEAVDMVIERLEALHSETKTD